jgi:hypothetical protein
MLLKTNFVKRITKIIAYILLAIVLIFFILIIYINTPSGKNQIKKQVASYLNKKLQTKVTIGAIEYSLPKWLEINNIYVQDQKQDTLLFGSKLLVDLNMFKLIKSDIQINKIALDNISINIKRQEKDSAFNYDFITKAFASNNKTTSTKDTSELKLKLDFLALKQIKVTFTDSLLGNDFTVNIDDLAINTKQIKPDRNVYSLDYITGKGISYTSHVYKENKVISAVVDSVENKTAYPFLFKVNTVKLNYLHVNIKNDIDNSFLENTSNSISVKNVEYNASNFKANVEEVIADKLNTTYIAPKQNQEKQVDTLVTPQPNLWNYKLGKLILTNSLVKYDDNNKPIKQGLDVAHLNAQKINVDVSNVLYSPLEKKIDLNHFSFFDKSGFGIDTAQANILLTNKNLDLKNLLVKTKETSILTTLNLSFDSLASISKYPNTVQVKSLYNNSSIALNDLYLLLPSIDKSLPKSKFANQKINLSTAISGDLAKLYLQYFQIKALTGSSVYATGVLNNVTDANKASLKLNIKESKFYKKDFLNFIPQEQLVNFKNLPDIINFVGIISANKNNIDATIKTHAKGFAFNGAVAAKNFSDKNLMQYGVSINNAYLESKLINGFLSPQLLETIQLPSNISLKGALSGGTNNINTKLKIVTSLGNINIDGFANNFKNTKEAHYNFNVNPNNFLLGNILKADTSIGIIDGKISILGKGFNPKTNKANAKINLNKLGYNKYVYENIFLNAIINNGNVLSNGKVNDEYLKLQYKLNANITNKYPTLFAKVNVDTANLRKLNFSKDTFNISLVSVLDIKNLQPQNLNAIVTLDSIFVQDKTSKYQLDSIALLASSSAGIDSVVLQSPFLNINAGGNFDYTLLGPSIINYVNNFYKFSNKPSVLKILSDQQFAFNGIIKKHPIIPNIISVLQSYEPIVFKGNYASALGDSALNFNLVAPSIVTPANKISNAIVNINSKNGELVLNAQVDTLQAGKNILLATNISAIAAKDSLSVFALTKDDKNINWFGLGGYAFIKQDVFTFHLRDTLILNYEKWKVATDNYIQKNEAGIIVNNFVLRSDSASISVKSKTLQPNSPIDISIKDFNLKSITSILNKDTLFVGGKLFVDATVSDFNKNLPAFTGNVLLNDLTYMQKSIGNISVNAQKGEENIINAILKLNGNDNDVSVNGSYFLQNTNEQFNAKLIFNPLQLKMLQNFAPTVLQNTSGTISGALGLQGKFTQPVWSGSINFNNANLGLVALGNTLKINDQKIVFDYPNISFPNFKIQDNNDRTLTVNGKLTSKSLSQFDLDIYLDTKNFEVVNTPKKVNSQVFGYAAVNVDVHVGGNNLQPKIEGDILVQDKSDVKLVLPPNNYEKNEGKEIVRFVDLDTFKIEQDRPGFKPAPELKEAYVKFLNYNLNVDISKNAALTILLDPATGDEIKVQGDARLNVGVDPGGNLVLAGNYDLNNGYYDFSYQFLKRKFNLVKGSTITFAGGPLDATVNITASYTANTNTKDLVGNEVANVSPTLANLFNQKFPFKVMLYLSGQLKKPIINFDVVIPDEVKNINPDLRSIIENKLAQIRNDQSSINKQVFSLLLFNKFAAEQSSDFFKGNGGGFNDIARQSVSQFLSSALNEIASDLLKGIDIDLNLNSYNDFSNGSNAQRTDLNVAVSKSFANDKLTVTVGKNFGIEGEGTSGANQQAATGFMPDVTVSYKLSPDGKYMLRAYTKNQYEVTLDGFVVETGMSFLVTLSYDRFNELFKKAKK